MFFYNDSDSEVSSKTGDGWNLQLKQTWETVDTDHIASGDIATRITSGTSATVVNHSTLSNAISFAGEKCLYINSYHYPYQSQRIYANTPELVSTSQTTAVSIRLLVRNISSYGGWFIMFRGRNDGAYDGGYVYGDNAGTLYGTGTGNIQGMTPNNVWKWYRADLIPQFNNGVWVNDKLEYYIADAAEVPEWTLVGETYQSSIAWDHGAYKYHQIRFQDYSQSSPNKIFWIDNLEFYTKEV